MDTVGDRIRELRRERGWSRRELAEVVGFGYSYVAALENNQIGKGGRLRRFAEVLGVNLRWLETGKGAKTAPRSAGDIDETLLTIAVRIAIEAFGAAGEVPSYPRLAAAVTYCYRLLHSGQASSKVARIVADNLATLGTTFASVTGTKQQKEDCDP